MSILNSEHRMKRTGWRLTPLLLTLVFAFAAFGGGLEDYRTRVDLAQKDVDDLIAEVSNIKIGSGSTERISVIAKRLRERLPSGEKIDVQGGIIESDTGWIAVELDDFDRRINLSDKQAVLVGIKERLASIDYRIEELEMAAAAERSKDEDKQKLAEILKRQEYQKPEPPKESLIQRWWREFMEWLNSAFPRPEVAPSSGGSLSSLSFVLQILLYVLLAAAIGFLIYRFVPFFANRLGRKTKVKKGDRVILGERIAADASAHGLFMEADDLARSGNLRLAIRKGYIALLCELSDRKLIGLARHKTNRDYLKDVRKRPQLFENMSGMTNAFERHWYGFQRIEAGEWEDFRATYQRAVSESGRN
jgi:hypothetical protein